MVSFLHSTLRFQVLNVFLDKRWLSPVHPWKKFAANLCFGFADISVCWLCCCNISVLQCSSFCFEGKVTDLGASLSSSDEKRNYSVTCIHQADEWSNLVQSISSHLWHVGCGHSHLLLPTKGPAASFSPIHPTLIFLFNLFVDLHCFSDDWSIHVNGRLIGCTILHLAWWRLDWSFTQWSKFKNDRVILIICNL